MFFVKYLQFLPAIELLLIRNRLRLNTLFLSKKMNLHFFQCIQKLSLQRTPGYKPLCLHILSVRRPTNREFFFFILYAMKLKALAYFFVFVQFSMLIFLLASGPWLANSNVGILVEVAGLFIGIIAIFRMQIGNFNLAPLPKAGGVLVTNGIYQYIRHPMYLAQLLALLPLVVESYTNFRMIGWSVLLINLVFKLFFEERNLRNQFPDYTTYMQKSWRLIPFIF